MNINFNKAYANEEVDEAKYLMIPGSLVKTPEDDDGWARFAEVFYIFTRKYYRPISGAEATKKMIEGGLTSLDPHTSIADEEEFSDRAVEMKGVFGGLGIEIQNNTDGKPGILIITPIDDTPASRAGIKAQDVIIEIDGQSTVGMKLTDAVKRMRGEPETTVTLTIARAGMTKPLVVTLIRAIIVIQYVKHELKQNGVGYIRVTRFGETVTELVKKSVESLEKQNGGKQLSGVILDLRNNPGGLLHVAYQLNNLFLDGNMHNFQEDVAGSKLMISEESRGKILENKKYYMDESPDITGGVPLVVLVNSGSASASEIVAKTLQVFGRATVAGPTKSFGKGTVQTIVPLQTGGALTLTTSQYLIGPEGCEQVIQNIGITPDIMIQGDANETEKEEAKLPDAVKTSTISNANCKYRYTLPEGHKDMAFKMLRVMDLKIKTEGSAQ